MCFIHSGFDALDSLSAYMGHLVDVNAQSMWYKEGCRLIFFSFLDEGFSRQADMTLRTISVRTGERFDEFDELVSSLLERIGGELQGTSSGGGRRDYYVRIEDCNYLRVLNALRDAGASIVEQNDETNG